VKSGLTLDEAAAYKVSKPYLSTVETGRVKSTRRRAFKKAQRISAFASGQCASGSYGTAARRIRQDFETIRPKIEYKQLIKQMIEHQPVSTRTRQSPQRIRPQRQIVSLKASPACR
jgi:hypothetical protein